jgi:alanine dehydrogenase
MFPTPELTIDECIPAVEQIFRDYGEGRVGPPKSLGIDHFHIKAAIGDVFAVKINANFPDNPRKHGLPTIQGVIVLFDRERGTPLLVLDSILITTLRTAAATAVAAKYLARPYAKTLAVIGYGTQGRAHVEAIKRVRNIATVRIFDAGGGEGCASIEEAVADADIVVTCTPSQSPILDARHLRPGMFIAGVGADNPQKHELSPALLKGSRVFADILEQSATMGDLHHAIAAGVMTREDVAGELADVVCGRAGRRSEDEVIVFDSTGTALQDLAAAQLVIQKSRG